VLLQVWAGFVGESVGHGIYVLRLTPVSSVVVKLRYCRDEKPSARIIDCARIKSDSRAIDDLV